MSESWIDGLLVCPSCRQGLQGSVLGERLACAGCGRTFPVRHGIPDLRLGGAIYHERGEEDAVVSEVAAQLEGLSHADAVRWYYRADVSAGYTEDSEVGVRWGLDSERHGELSCQEAEQMVRLARETGRLAPGDPAPAAVREGGYPQLAMEIGCGSSGALASLARRFDRVVGLNISLPELLLARKFLAERALTERVVLLCASADALPLRDDVVGAALAEDTVEHLAAPGQALREIVRTLAPGGWLFFNSPNRYALFHPEGHVKLWWLGFLPRALQDPYVRLRRGRPYRGIRCLSLLELERLLTRLEPAGDWLLFTPDLRPEASSLLGRLYRQAHRLQPRLAELIYQSLRPGHDALFVKRASPAAAVLRDLEQSRQRGPRHERPARADEPILVRGGAAGRLVK